MSGRKERRRRTVTGRAVLGVACLAGSFACVQVLGIEKPPLDPGSDAAIEGAAVDAGTGEDGSRDAEACVEGAPARDTDDGNCGRCGHSCLGGTCADGKCQPVRIGAASDVRGVALDGEYVYYTSYASGAVSRVKKDGTDPKTLGTTPAAWGLDVGGGQVVWASGEASASVGGVYRCPKDGCAGAPTRVVALPEISDVALTGARTGDTFVFAEYGSSTVSRWDGSGVVPLATAGRPFKLAVDDTYVYYKSILNSLFRAPLSGLGGATAVGEARGSAISGGVAVRRGRVFWTAGDLKDNPGFVRSADTADVTSQTAYFNAAVLPNCVAADDTSVYWGTQGNEGTLTGGVYACPIAGCAQATTLLTNLDRVQDIEVDDQAIYVGLYGGGVLRLAKP